MVTETIKNKILGVGFSVLEGVDPNPDNFVSASIIHTRTQQVGCLLRLEPNKEVQVRTSYFVSFLYLFFFLFGVLFRKIR